MDTIVCGDLHGRIEIARELLKEKDKNIVFVGDYLDSFDRVVSDQIRLLELILDAVENNDRVIALMGNHELSYLDKNYRCSGYNAAMQFHIDPIRKQLWDKLKPYAIVDSFLVTHAGVSNGWFRTYYPDPDPNKIWSLEDVDEKLSAVSDEAFFKIGNARGGISAFGGPLWCDAYMEFKPLRGIKQIFGHTEFRDKEHGDGVYSEYNDNWCVDCLSREREVGLVSNGKFSILKF